MTREREKVMTRRTFAVTLGGALGTFSEGVANAKGRVPSASSVRLILPPRRSAIVDNIARLFRRVVTDRCEVKVVTDGDAELRIDLALKSGIGKEGFTIADGENGTIGIIGNEERGLLFGVGKFLRSSGYEERSFTPGAWRGTSVPSCPVRGIYFATHFYNFYHNAPVAEIERYVEELGLWGFNVVSVWFDMHHYKGINDPEAKLMIERLRRVLGAANKVGMGAALTTLANEAYAGSPEELRADWTIGHDGYTRPLPHYHVEICPNKPGGMDLILKWRREMFDVFSDLNVDNVWIWPYDSGGCTCSKCAPWGANGFLRAARPISALIRQQWPSAKTVLATWLFDRLTTGEWKGLATAMAKDKSWVDYIMVDTRRGLPSPLLTQGALGNMPLLDFPEISMWNMGPWGAYGANPLPGRFERLWNSVKERVAGGFPYSEGIYEDINKALYAQFYWKANQSSLETLRGYITFEYSAAVVPDILSVIKIFENNHTRHRDGAWPDEKALEAYEIVKRVDAKLTPKVRDSWRWRLVYLRARIDAELHKSKGEFAGEPLQASFDELAKMYHYDRYKTEKFLRIPMQGTK